MQSSKQHYCSKVSVLHLFFNGVSETHRLQSSPAVTTIIPLRSDRFFLLLLNLRWMRQWYAAVVWVVSISRAMAWICPLPCRLWCLPHSQPNTKDRHKGCLYNFEQRKEGERQPVYHEADTLLTLAMVSDCQINGLGCLLVRPWVASLLSLSISMPSQILSNSHSGLWWTWLASNQAKTRIHNASQSMHIISTSPKN